MTDQLLERDAELGSVESLLDEVVEGAGRVLLFEGPAGIGKTSLLSEARRLGAAVGMRDLVARGSELEREFPYGVVRQLFEPLLADPAQRDALLAGGAAGAGAVFGSPSADEEGSPDASFAVLHGLYWLVVNATAERPLLLAVDDLHWCDQPSLRFLAFLVRRLEGLPVALAATLRDSEPGTDPTLLGEIAGDPATHPIRPAPLSEAAVGDLLAARLAATTPGGRTSDRSAGESATADRAFVAACHEAVGGNPLLLRQLLRALEAEGVAPTAANAALVADVGPRAVSRTVLVRLSRLPDAALALARAAAVLGDGAELPQLARQAGLSEPDAAEAIAALARTEILRPEPPLGFVHPLVREAIYQDLPAGERELQHERAAHDLLAAGAAPEQIASHLLKTPRRADPTVVETLRAAADSATAKGAATSAVAYLRRALEEPPPAAQRPRVLFELGSAEAFTSGPDSVEHLREARAGLEDDANRAEAALVLARNQMISGDPAAAAAAAREAAAELPPQLADYAPALEALALAAVFFGAGEHAELERLDELRPPAPGAPPGERLLAAMAAYHWTYRGRPAADCAAMALAALGPDHDLLALDNSVISIAAIMPLVFADREEAMGAWESSARLAHRRGSTFDVSGVHLWRGTTYLHRGELEDAEADLRGAVEDQRVFGSSEIPRSYTAGLLATVLVERGDPEGAARALGAAEQGVDGTDGRRHWLEGRLALELDSDRDEQALATAERLREEYAWVRNPALARWRSGAARALARLDRADEGVALLEEELALARAYGAPATVGRILRTLGTATRDPALLDEAISLLEPAPARLELAKALAARGTALRLDRKPTDAREPLRRALELAEACAAAPLAAHLRAELQATGARPRTAAASGPESLTASERRVATLAADGATNREIAQELFVTPKTVEVHLSNSYRKLGIRSRRELPAILAA